MSILRRLSSALVAVSVLLAVIFAFASPAPQQQLTVAQTLHQPQFETLTVEGDDIQLVADAKDCFAAAAEVYWGMQIKGFRIAVSLAKFKTAFVGVAGLIPGVDCGRYLGQKNVAAICWMTNRPWYVPGVLHARGLVWLITGSQTNRC